FGVTVQGAGAHVEGALVLDGLPVAQVERGIAHEQADQFPVGHVHHGLARFGEPVSGLGMRQGPLLVEAVDVGARHHPRFALFEAAAHADVPVGQRDQGFAGRQLRHGQTGTGHLPRVHLVAWPVRAVLGGVTGLAGVAVLAVPVADRFFSWAWPRSRPVGVSGAGCWGAGFSAARRSASASTTTFAPASARAWAWSSRFTPITYPKLPARPACTPEIASSITTASAGSTPSAWAPARKVSGAGLPGRERSAATRPSMRASNSSLTPAASTTAAPLAEAVTIAVARPAVRTARR